MSESDPIGELLPCPFCGGEGDISWYAKADNPAVAGYYVECGSCSAGGEPFDIQGEMPDRDEYTRQKAIDAWNHREAASLRGLGKGNSSSVAESAASRFALTASETPCQSDVQPTDMILFCPACGVQHIDEVRNGVWENPPHRSHLCYGCGHIWRPADVPTNGVAAIKTVGKADSPRALPTSSAPQSGEAVQASSAQDEPLSSTPDQYEGGPWKPDREVEDWQLRQVVERVMFRHGFVNISGLSLRQSELFAAELKREVFALLALPQHRTSSDGEGAAKITCREGRYFYRGWKTCERFGGDAQCHPFGCTLNLPTDEET